jgi:phage protein D
MANAYLSVKLQGQDVSDLVLRARVEESDTQADLATLVFGNSDLILSDVLGEGLSVEIDLGTTDEHGVVFRGSVTSLRASFPLRGPAEVELQAIDTLIQLGLQPKTKRWSNTTLSEMVRETALGYGLLPGQIAPDEDVLISDDRPRQQVELTDLAFLRALAREYDCKLFVDHPAGPDTLNFVSTKQLVGGAPISITLAYGGNVSDFQVEANVAAGDPKRRLVSTDPDTGETVQMERDLVGLTDLAWAPDPARIAAAGAAATRAGALMTSFAPAYATLAAGLRVAPRQAGAPARPSSQTADLGGDWARRLGMTGRGRAGGSVWLRPRKPVTLTGFGGRWSGAWYIARVRHDIDVARNRYTCDFVCTQ